MVQQILTVKAFETYSPAIVAIGLVALVAIFAPKWVMKLTMVVAGAALTAYAGAVLFVRIPKGIPHGSLTLMACFLFGAVWTLLWSLYFYNEWKETRSTD